MTMHVIHHAHFRPIAALAPVLLPVGLDKLLERRLDACRMGDRIVNRSALPYHLARVLGDFERRIDARIAQVLS